jgi:type I restriction enzyme, S subunit
MAANLSHSRAGGNPATLITECLDIWTSADTTKKSGRGRSSGNATSVYGIKKLRELILELAVRGKLVPQDANDEPASELLKKIQVEKEKLIKAGKIKKDKPLLPVTVNEKPFELPSGWEWTRLGEITNFGAAVKLDSISDDCWVLDLEDIEKDTSQLLQKVRFIDRGSLSEKNAFFSGDILYGKLRPYLNKVIVADENGVCTTEILPIRCFGPFNSHYFKFALKSPNFITYVTARSYGMKMPRLGTDDGRQACFPLPPLVEQHRIVAKVDELMALCDQLETQHNNAAEAHEKIVSVLLETLTQSSDAKAFTENWQRIATHFDTLFTTETSIDALKQTLLQLAVMGKLVQQDKYDEPASELLKRIKAEKAKLVAEGKAKKDKPLAAIDESPFDLPSNWAWARFPEIGEFGRGKSKHRPRNDPRLFNPGIYPLVQTGEVARADNLISEYHSKYSDIGLAQSKMWPTGTMCITIAANIADSAILGFDACFPDSVVGFVPYAPLNDSRYFLSFMKTARENLLKFAPATAQKNINLEILESVLIPLPPLKEISRIVTKLDELMTLCDQLKTRITAANQCQQKLADVMIEKAVA